MTKIACSALVAVLLCAYSVNAHLYLDHPVSMEGTGSSGGQAAPCFPTIPTTGTVTALTAGQSFKLQMRANLHGTDPFSVRVSYDGGNTFGTTIASGLAYKITATTSDTYNGFQINLTAPAQTCSKCILQLSGMGPPTKWYQCAYISISSPQCGQGFCTNSDQGVCDEDTNTCKCKKNYAGINCDIYSSSSNGKTVEYTMVLYVSKADFNKDLFIQTLAANAGLSTDSIDVISIKKGSDDYVYDTTAVVIQLSDSDSMSAIDAAGLLQARYDNDQSLGPYTVVAFTNEGKSSGKGKKDNSGQAAGATIGVLLAIGLLGGGYYYYKKNH